MRVRGRVARCTFACGGWAISADGASVSAMNCWSMIPSALLWIERPLAFHIEMMSLRFIAFHPIDRLDLPALRVNILYPSKPDVIRLLFPGKIITDILLWRKMN